MAIVQLESVSTANVYSPAAAPQMMNALLESAKMVPALQAVMLMGIVKRVSAVSPTNVKQRRAARAMRSVKRVSAVRMGPASL